MPDSFFLSKIFFLMLIDNFLPEKKLILRAINLEGAKVRRFLKKMPELR